MNLASTGENGLDTTPNTTIVHALNSRCMCDCGWRGEQADLLRAPDPFNPGDELVACPNCRQQEDLKRPCDIEGCWKETTCGGTFADGVYRCTCGPHAEWTRARAPLAPRLP